MLLIIAHHYVVNSNVLGVIKENPAADASMFLTFLRSLAVALRTGLRGVYIHHLRPD